MKGSRHPGDLGRCGSWALQNPPKEQFISDSSLTFTDNFAGFLFSILFLRGCYMPNKRFPLTGIASGLATRPPRKATRINQSTAQTPNRNMKLRKHHNQTINSIQSNHHYITCINLVHISLKKRTNVPWTRHEHTIQSHSIESERHFHKKSHETSTQHHNKHHNKHH